MEGLKKGLKNIAFKSLCLYFPKDDEKDAVNGPIGSIISRSEQDQSHIGSACQAVDEFLQCFTDFHPNLNDNWTVSSM